MSSLVYDISEISIKEALELYRCLIDGDLSSFSIEKKLVPLIERRLFQFEVGEEVTMKWKSLPSSSDLDDDDDNNALSELNSMFIDEDILGYVLAYLVFESKNVPLANHLFEIMEEKCDQKELNGVLYTAFFNNLKDWALGRCDDRHIPDEYIWIFERCEFSTERWLDMLEDAVRDKDILLVKTLIEFRPLRVDRSKISEITSSIFTGKEAKIYDMLQEL